MNPLLQKQGQGFAPGSRLFGKITPANTPPKVYPKRISLLFLLPLLMVLFSSHWVKAQFKYNFTAANAVGATGPTQAQVNTAYTSTNLAGKVTVIGSGKQKWTVPNSGIYLIRATGASGGAAISPYFKTGGLGASMEGQFTLVQGDIIEIIVGQKGVDGCGGGGGGGGTFVLRNGVLLLAAGGGGGASSDNNAANATTATSGTNDNPGGAVLGGVAGGGGQACNVAGANHGGGGAGYTGNGATSTLGTPGAGGVSYTNGGLGGASAPNGGFGGGGGSTTCTVGGGGGGGYSGGAGGQQVNYCKAGINRTGGGGGGSYNIGSKQINLAGVQTGDGKVYFEVLSSNAYNDAGVIAIDSPAVFCVGINNVVTRVQNFGKNKIDSVTVNWTVNGVLQTPKKSYIKIDTIGGLGSNVAVVALGSYNFNSTAYTLKAWTSLPNGVADTVKTNDSTTAIKQVNLPSPKGANTSSLTSTSTTVSWLPGAVSNTWAYTNSTVSTKPVGPGTIVTTPSVNLAGLMPRTNYYFYVREICSTGDSSVWEGPFIYRTPCSAPLNGNYTVDPTKPVSSTNFVNLTEVVTALIECQITGPVVFNIAPGTYTERLVISEVPGASAINTVSFVGSGIGSTILANTATGTADMVNVILDGADYITFRDMTVRSSNVTNGVAFLITNQADYNRLENMHLQLNNTSTGGNTAGVAFSASKTSTTTSGITGNYNVCDSLLIEGGYYGVTLRGTSTTVYSIGNQFTYCTFIQQNYYAMYNYYSSKVLIDHCVAQPTRNTSGNGIYCVNLSNCQISNNTINAQAYGLYLSSFNSSLYDNKVRSMVYNNIIYGSSTYGFYSTTANNFGFYHNSINVSSGYAARFSSGTGVTAVNNQIKNYRNTASSYALYINSMSFDTLDYNNYISYGSGAQFYHDVAYNDFDAYRKGVSFYNANSYNKEPNYISTANAHITQSIANIPGVPVGIDTDIDGDSRCSFAPTLGADESYFPTPTPNALIAKPDTAYAGSPSTFYSAYKPLVGVALDYTWYLNGVKVDNKRDYTSTFANGTYNLALKVRSCQASDSSATSFTAVSPTRTPLTDFTASKLVVDKLEKVKFADISKYGVTTWEWTASPSSEVIWDNALAPSPTAFFLTEGQYEICLKTENALGVGTTKCKTAYITVNDEQNFCSSTESSIASGRINDEGGANGNYTSNTNCSFLIKPCADRILLKFSQFDLADASDVLTIYDGIDANATLIGSYTSGSALPGGTTGLVANSGFMFLTWTTNASGNGAGFSANWTSTPNTKTPVPTANFSTPDTVFTDQIARFTSTSTGVYLGYSWDFNPPFKQDGLEGGELNYDRYRWNAPGTYPVELTVTNCGGKNAIKKLVKVIDPVSKPVVGFYANKLKVPVLNIVTFYDTSKQGPSSWKWEVTPSLTADILSATNEEQLKVSFTKAGMYTVKLIATNKNGADSLVRTNYIEVFNYCDPVAGSLSADIGISRVKLGSIDNFSAIGVNRYSTYINDLTPEVVYRRGSVDITMYRNSITDFMNRKVWVDWNNDGDFDDSLELVASEPAAKTFSFTSTIAIPSFANLGYTVLRIGTSYGNDKNTACGINPTGEFEDYPLQIAIDNVKPVITTIGSDTVRVEQWYQYVDASATAVDGVDGNLKSSIVITNNVDTTKVGTYYITYNVTDIDGNKADTRTRVVLITPDVTRPVLTLIGNTTETVVVNTTYTDAGATAMDYFNRNLTNAIASGDNIDLGKLGAYYVYFTVQDASGNKDSIVRTVNVIDNIAPTITLNGGDTISVDVFTLITDPGYVANDNYYTSVNVSVDNSKVNLSVVGIYPIVYTGVDGSGNTTTATRYVSVEDNTAPVLTLIGKDTVSIDVNADYFEQGAKVTDNYCNGVLWSVDKAPDTKKIGDYVLTYSAIDCQNNAAITLTRVVKVVDRIAPVLYLKGLPTVSTQRWVPYVDAGVKITDNYYDSTTLKGLLTVTSNIDYLIEGVYSICYEVSDPSGNASNQVCRVVTVGANTTGVNEVDFAKQFNLYPNPSNGNFTIDFGGALNQATTLTVLDMTGRVVYNQKVSALTEKQTIDIVGLPSGVYMVRIEQGANHAVLRATITQ